MDREGQSKGLHTDRERKKEKKHNYKVHGSERQTHAKRQRKPKRNREKEGGIEKQRGNIPYGLERQSSELERDRETE